MFKLIRTNYLNKSITYVKPRYISQSLRVFNEPLPSSKDMKEEKWDIVEESDSENVTSKVIGMTSLLEDTREPPLDIDDSFARNFRQFETYDPFDLSMNQLDITRREHKQRNKTSRDPFERSGINPLNLYTMPVILSRFLSSTGQILPRQITGCNAKNQKKLAIAIERARASGLLSTVHKDVSFLPSRNL